MLKTTDARGNRGMGTSMLLDDESPRHEGTCAYGSHDCDNRLDEVFEKHHLKTVEQDYSAPLPKQVSAIDRLRHVFVNELIPVVNELREKYASKGLNLQMNAERFLSGKREIVIEMQFDGIGMRYNGTVIEGVIAFNQTRYDIEDRSGLTASGAALRTRDLDADKFRTFLCDRIAHLVQQASKRHR